MHHERPFSQFELTIRHIVNIGTVPLQTYRRARLNTVFNVTQNFRQHDRMHYNIIYLLACM